MRKPKYEYCVNALNGAFITITKTGEIVYKSEDPVRFAELHKKWKAAKRRRDRDQLYRDLGLTKVKGAVSGKTYWE